MSKSAINQRIRALGQRIGVTSMILSPPRSAPFLVYLGHRGQDGPGESEAGWRVDVAGDAVTVY